MTRQRNSQLQLDNTIIDIQLQLDITTRNLQLQLDKMSMSLQLQLDNSPQNLQLQRDDSTRIFQLQLEILTTELFPNQPKSQLIMWGSMPHLIMSMTVIIDLHSAEVVRIPHD
jgi:hypothetical protein